MAPATEQHECQRTLSLHAALQEGNGCAEGVDSVNRRGAARKVFKPYHSKSVPRETNLHTQAQEHEAQGKQVTTMMLRNIPNKYSQHTLLQEIENNGFHGSYDFFYLPMDAHNRSNVGYAFVNFKDPMDAARFQCIFSAHRFQRFHSRKVGVVCTAHLQGLEENLRHFQNRAVAQSRNDQYRPIALKGSQRVNIEEALADAKGADCGPEAHGAGAGCDSGTGHPRRTVLPTQAWGRHDQEACARLTVAARGSTPPLSPSPPPPQILPSTVLMRSKPVAPPGLDAREGLEDAIRLLLRTMEDGEPGRAQQDLDAPQGVDSKLGFMQPAYIRLQEDSNAELDYFGPNDKTPRTLASHMAGIFGDGSWSSQF